MHDQQVVLLGEGDDLAIDLRRAHAAHRVGGQRDDDVLGLVCHLCRDVCHMGQKVMLGAQGVVVGLGTGHHHAGLEDGVAGVGQQDDIAGVAQSEAEVAHALLGAAARCHHVRCDALDAKAAGIVVAHGLLELRKVAQAVLPVGGVCASACQGVLDVLGRHEVRRADAQVVDGPPLPLELDELLVERGEDLFAEFADAVCKADVEHAASSLVVVGVFPCEGLPSHCVSRHSTSAQAVSRGRGLMADVNWQTTSGLERHRALGSECIVSTVLFDTSTQVICDRQPIAQLRPRRGPGGPAVR